MRIICDLDGTLLDGKWQYFYAHGMACDKLGVDAGSIDAYWQARREGKSAYNVIENRIHRSLTRKERRIYIREAQWASESPEALTRMMLLPEAIGFLKEAGSVFLATFRRNSALLMMQLRKFDIEQYIKDKRVEEKETFYSES